MREEWEQDSILEWLCLRSLFRGVVVFPDRLHDPKSSDSNISCDKRHGQCALLHIEHEDTIAPSFLRLSFSLSVRLSIRPSFCPLFRPSIRPSIRPSVYPPARSPARSILLPFGILSPTCVEETVSIKQCGWNHASHWVPGARDWTSQALFAQGNARSSEYSYFAKSVQALFAAWTECFA